jgi:DNA-binding transcriptional regulator LsrR (DeoR family)
MKTGDIAFVIKDQDKTLRYLLRLADIENVKMKYEQALSTRELSKQLGVDHRIITRLVEEGHLRRNARRTVDGYHGPKFDVDTARRLLHNITSV